MLYIFSIEPAFEDITISLISSLQEKGIIIKRLRDLGPNTNLTKKTSKDIVIMLGLNTFNSDLPHNYIAYQLEQSKPVSNASKDSFENKNNIGETKSWFTDTYLKRLEGAIEIWDYSMQNIVNVRSLFKLKNLTLPKTRYVPFTFLPVFSSSLGNLGLNPLESSLSVVRASIHENRKNNDKDIDVLFYGSVNPRREKIMQDLEAAGYRVHFAGYNLWGEARDNLIKRSKIVLNIHFYADPILETTRLAPLVSQGAFVISEPSSDKILDIFWSKMVTFCPYEKIVEKVGSFLKVYESCEIFARVAHQELQKFPYLDKLSLTDLSKYLNSVEDPEVAKFVEDSDDSSEEEAVVEKPTDPLQENPSNDNKTDTKQKERNKREKEKSDPRKRIRKATCKREDTEDGGKAEVLELINISDDKLPTVTIVTPTYNRSELLPIALRNFRKTIYPEGNLEWIVLDDSNETHRAKNRELLKGDIRIKYLEFDQKMSISEKRNYLVYKSTSDYIVHMDDDDYYYPESVLARIKLLLKYKDEGIKCVGCTEIGIYHLLDNYSYLMDCGSYLSEASMAYHRSFWEERPFPSDKEMAKMSSKTGEGALFLERRLHQVIDMPFIFNFIAVTHKKNVTGRLRTYNLDKDAKLNGTNFFNLWDIDTQLFFIKISRSVAKSNNKE